MRRTISRTATVTGTGLHLGVACSLEFRPAPSGSGIRFERRDLPSAPPIPADAAHAVLTDRRTQLGEEPNAVHTVEHVLAAVAALEIDDLLVSLDGPEPPIMDGSAQPFLDALREAGAHVHAGCVHVARLTTPVRLVDGESLYEAAPSEHLDLDVTIDFPHAMIGRQRYAARVTPELFERELGWARTFGFVREVEPLRAMGLIRGASTQNAVVLDDAGVVENSLRSPDEFVRHKMMDCVGDLALVGARLKARVVAHKPSHRGTVLFVRAMQASLSRESQVLGIEEIMKVLPHRYPFLLVDRITEFEPDKRIVGIKNVTLNERYLARSDDGPPALPPTILTEAVAQVGAIMILAKPENRQRLIFFAGIERVRYRRPVHAGDVVVIEANVVRLRSRMGLLKGVARVDGQPVIDGTMTFALGPPQDAQASNPPAT